MTTTPIDIPFPDEGALDLRVSLGACRVRIGPGDGDAWVSGSYEDPTDAAPLRLVQEAGRVEIGQRRTVGGAVRLLRSVPACELALGSGRSYRLTVETGASEAEIDLGGMPLTGLVVRAGAGRVALEVSSPNPDEVAEADFRFGAGALEIHRLGNLNARTMRFEGGAAGLVLDLTGEDRVTSKVRLNAGMSGVEMTVPADRPCRITTDTTLGGVDIGDGFVTRGGALWTAAPDIDAVPTLQIDARIALGGLKVRTA